MLNKEVQDLSSVVNDRIEEANDEILGMDENVTNNIPEEISNQRKKKRSLNVKHKANLEKENINQDEDKEIENLIPLSQEETISQFFQSKVIYLIC